MTNSHRLEAVRKAIRAWLDTETKSQAGSTEGASMVESFLIRDEFFCGRQFRTNTHRATWFVEEDELKIHEMGGDLCLSIRGEQIDDLAASGSASGETEDESTRILPMRRFLDENDEQNEIRRAA